MHINKKGLIEFDNGNMNTQEVIEFLSHLDHCDFCLDQMMEQEGITEELKSRDQMEWVRRANNARSRVDEIILNELVYV